jgi:DNA-binding transcriptional MerR regulator
MSDSKYQSRHVQTLFDISNETLRQWSMTFEKHLSPTANPEKGRHRQFSHDDLRAFATIKRLKDEGKINKDILTYLKTGQALDDAPALPEDVELLEVLATPRGLEIVEYIQQLASRINTLEGVAQTHLLTQIDTLEDKLSDERSKRDELMKQIGRLETLLEIEQQKNRDVEDN